MTNTENFNNLFAKYVPQSGSCETVGGELLRATAKISYECYNNGFGNNVSGALNFLKHNGIDLQTDNVYLTLNQYCCGRILSGYDDDAVHKMVELVRERVEEYVTRIPAIFEIPNTVDMYDLTDTEYFNEEEEYDYDEE